VPPDTQELIVAARATIPIMMDVTEGYGDPDRLAVSLPGNIAIGRVRDLELFPSAWFAIPEPAGPFPPTAYPTAARSISGQ